MKNLILGIVISILFSCNSQDRIVGKWERIGDEYQGLRVEVNQIGDKFIGKLIHVTPTAKSYGLVLQDVKWKDIIKINDSVYEFNDLAKGYNYLNYITSSYSDYYLTFVSDNVIKMRKDFKGNEPWGTEQLWYRIEDN